MPEIVEKVKKTVTEHGLIAPGSRVLAGFSGGADSTALVLALLALSKEMGFELCCAHFNHGIRGQSAEDDERFVKQFCEERGIPVLTERGDVPKYAAEHGLSLETAARLLRYDFLRRAMRALGAQRIAVAHHMDDNAESVLLHLIRGSGLKGLTGMSYSRGELIRPLLDVRRSEIEAFLRERGVCYRTDETNLIPEGSRNIVRLEIMPLLKRLNPSAAEAICGCAELLRQDEALLAARAEKALDAAKTPKGYDRAALNELPMPILSRAIRIALERAGVNTDIERVHVLKIIELLEKSSGASLCVPHARIRLNFNEVILEHVDKTVDNTNKLLIHEYLSIAKAGETRITTPFGSFTAKYVPLNEKRHYDVNRAYLDADTLEFPLLIRTRRAGDRFYPANSAGERKLKDYFIAKKLDAAERDNIPLVTSRGAVAFIPGFGIGNGFKLTEKTQRVVLIQYSFS